MKSFADIIRAIRNSGPYTQREIAEMIDITPAAVSDWERGITIPTAPHRRALKEHFPEFADDIDRFNATA